MEILLNGKHFPRHISVLAVQAALSAMRVNPSEGYKTMIRNCSIADIDYISQNYADLYEAAKRSYR